MSAQIESFSRFSADILDLCKRSENEFTRLAPKWIAGCFELDQELPDKYGWRLSDVAVIQQQLAKRSDVRKINRIYWEDQARNVEAYSLMSF